MEAALFDLDKTIIARSSALVFGRPFYKEGLITRSTIVKGMYAQLVYHLVGADEGKMDRMRQALLELTKGWDKEKVSQLVRDALEEIIDPIIYAEALQLIEEHQAAGRRVYIVSSSAEEIVKPLAEYIGVQNVIATRAKIDDAGHYTGELEFYAYAEGKREAILAEAEQHDIDLSASYAYSDSITDLPMLETVGHPHAVNPDKELRKVAEERGWPVLTFARPVSLSRRIVQGVPRPSPTAAALAGATVIAVLAWAWLRRSRAERPAA
jgi:HAD superfamily hydrolase (TIGR01490 family)